MELNPFLRIDQPNGNQPAKLQAIIADSAGTTIDFGSRAPARVFVETSHRRNVSITEQQAREPMGMSKREHLAAITKIKSVVAAWIAAHGRPPNEDDVDSMYRQFLPL